ncbi:uncharacterized protein KY384_001032 [Bacidia gigantensis]|uniref:uncharacterized protein n=1 Tax=Bacidia gigantensis TaxID=2732470 RepID=UPI001D03956A|nr:uncharacterized protein KY384_001032 [Bacidia gigantensis]KAG8534188.1 hypothetical protein KY384_001032 [Bacidia gigantensis]
MARQKQAAPLRREPSDFERLNSQELNGSAKVSSGALRAPALSTALSQPGLTQLLICVAGIYASFLTWALLQERITTTSYGSVASPERFTYAVFLNTIQSSFAVVAGYAYLLTTTAKDNATTSIFPSKSIFVPLVLVAVTSSLASPFGYASLSHVDYITFILAKSCKLLPVMFLHLTVFRKSYPLYKYLVVALVTAGVAVFTLYHPSSAKKASSTRSGNSVWGLLLLGINLLFDGLTNSTQDHIFSTNRHYTGPQMMVAQNLLSTALTTFYLLVSPLLPATLFFEPAATTNTNELAAALDFIARHPSVFIDILSFAACGAVGQIFIYYTLSKFSSLLLVTVTVTRKMLTMILSVLWFGHRLTEMQWVGVALVFGGVGAEGWIQRREKIAKEKRKANKAS